MKTANEIADKHNTNSYGADRGDVIAAMKEYAKEVIDHILTRDDLIRTDEGDAVYNYSEFERLKNELK